MGVPVIIIGLAIIKLYGESIIIVLVSGTTTVSSQLVSAESFSAAFQMNDLCSFGSFETSH